jgi:hypothetical protein
VLLIALCVVANVFFSIRDFQVDPTRVCAGSLVSLALLAVGLVWQIIIKMSFVEDAGRTFALRLLAQCDVLEIEKAAKGRKERAVAET